MFRSLRWQLVVAFGLVILLVVLLGGTLSIWTTARRFDILVTEEGQARAYELAPLLEASYAYRGDWDGLYDLLSDLPEPGTPPEFFEPVWGSDVDWWSVSASTLGLSDIELNASVEEYGSIASVAAAQGIDADVVVQAIIQAEQDAFDEAAALGLPVGDEAQALEWVGEGAVGFVFEEIAWTEESWWPDWYAIVAAELEADEIALFDALDGGQTIEEFAQQRDVSPEHLVEVILEAEETAAQEAGYSSDDVQGYVSGVEEEVWAFLEDNWWSNEYGPEPAWTDEGAYWLISNLLLSRDRLLVADDVGRVVFDSEREMRGQVLPHSMLARGASLFDRSDQDTEKQIGTVIVAAGPGFYNAHQAAFLQGVNLSLVISGLVAGVIALVVGLLLARRFTAPVTALTTASRSIADGDWHTRVPVRSSDELGQMSMAFNRMAGELENQRELRNRLVDALAHELSTPLSVIQLEVEAMRDGMQQPIQAATNVVREIDLLRSLVDDLTLLAETDRGVLQIHPQSTDLVALVNQARARWQPQADATGVALVVEWTGPGDDLRVQADPVRIGQVLGNLLSNALRHTPYEGCVTVCVMRADEHAHVIVRDTGEGIPADDQPHVFERFYRADRSRSRTTGGRGLGLSIVRRIVESHGGRVWVESQIDVGSAFGFSLPLERRKT